MLRTVKYATNMLRTVKYANKYAICILDRSLFIWTNLFSRIYVTASAKNIRFSLKKHKKNLTTIG